MKTVKELKEELSKFNDDNVCYAYDADYSGIIIERKGSSAQGIIHCCEWDIEEGETELIGEE